MTYEHLPRLESIRRGQDSRIRMNVRDADGTVRDWTGASVSVTFTPDAGDPFTKFGELETAPDTEPQAYVDVASSETDMLIAPQQIKAVVTATLIDGKQDRPAFVIPLLS